MRNSPGFFIPLPSARLISFQKSFNYFLHLGERVKKRESPSINQGAGQLQFLACQVLACQAEMGNAPNRYAAILFRSPPTESVRPGWA